MQSPRLLGQADSLNWVAVIRRYRSLFIASLVLGPMISLELYAVAPSTYVAETVLSLISRNLQILPADALIDPRSRDTMDLRSELDVISSRSLAERVAQSLTPTDLLAISNFGLVGQLRADLGKIVHNWWPSLFEWLHTTHSPRPPIVQEESAADRILQSLKVSNDGRSYTVYVSFTAASPTVAQKVADAYGQQYLAQQSDLHSATAKLANQWLASKLTDLRISLEKSENAVQAYRRSIGQVDPNGPALRAQTLSSLNNELAAARAVRLSTEARLEIANVLLQADDGISAFQEVLASPLVQSLRKEQTDLTRSIGELESLGSTKSGQLPLLRLRLASIKEQIGSETSRIIASLQNEIKVASKKEAQLEADFVEAQRQSVSTTEATVHLNQLEREAAANKAVYESFLNRYKQTIEQENIPAPETRILSHARVPSVASNPRLAFYLMVGLVSGALLASTITAICYWFDDSIATLGELEALVETPVLGALPKKKRFRLPSGRRRPTRSSEAAMHRLNATLQMFRSTRQVQVAAFVSVQSRREEAEFCIDLARTIAADGRSVVLVDAGTGDSTFEVIAAENDQRQKACLVPIDRIDDALWTDKQSELRVLATSCVSPFSKSAFDQSAWQALLDSLRERFEVVLVYVRVSAESVHAERYLSNAGATLLIASIGATARKAVSRAVRHLGMCGISIVGLVALGAEESFASVHRARAVDLDEWTAPHGVRRRRVTSQLAPLVERQGSEVARAL